MTDTHCHLSYQPLMDDLGAVLQRAADAGVARMITIGTKLADCLKCLEIAATHQQISCAVGIHPHHAQESSDEELEQVLTLIRESPAVAAGEMGLDYHYDFSPRDRQLVVFERQIATAVEANKPLVLHSRESVEDCLSVLREQGYPRGVLHCFTGTMAEAKAILDAGYYIGITGVVTFRKSDVLREIVKLIPDDRLLIETDAPYLAPEPLRKRKTNEPSLIVHTFARIAAIRGIPITRLSDVTDQNTNRLFGL